MVFPVPGGPIRRAALLPTFHLLYHSTNLSLASSFPTIASMLFGLYLSLHNQRAPPTNTKRPTSIPRRATLFTTIAFAALGFLKIETAK